MTSHIPCLSVFFRLSKKIYSACRIRQDFLLFGGYLVSCGHRIRDELHNGIDSAAAAIRVHESILRLRRGLLPRNSKAFRPSRKIGLRR